MKQSVCGIVKTNLEAENLVNALRSNGFVYQEISALFPDQEGSKDFAHKNATKAPEGTVAGVGTGGVVGGVFGLLAGIGTIAIPGVGPLIAAGPIMATLSGAAVGATVGGIAGGLIGMGIPEYEAKMYEGKIREGNILLAIHCNNNDELKKAEEIYKRHNVSAVHRVGEVSVKK